MKRDMLRHHPQPAHLRRAHPLRTPAPRAGTGGARVLVALTLLLMASAPALPLRAQVPPALPNLQQVPAGSLVIPMDNDKQNEGAPFNIRAYGLVNDLLHAGIPVKWVIRAGKGKDAVDFTATATRYAPTALAAASVGFKGGPFVVHKTYAALAKARIAAWNAAAPTARVAVYELTAPATMDVRYDLHFKPLPFINLTNIDLAAPILDAAGIPYVSGDNAQVLGNGCYSVLIEPHNDNTSAIREIRTFLQGGGNFYAQCHSVPTFENDSLGHFQTTAGVSVKNTGGSLAYPNPDMPFSQFVGDIDPTPAGSVQDWELAKNSTFRPTTHVHAQPSGSATIYSATAAQPFSGGGMVFYNGGHDYRGSTLPLINMQRMMLNAVLTPSARPTACGFEIPLPDLTLTKTHTGALSVDSLAVYTLTALNGGTLATQDTVVVTDTLPAGATYVSAAGDGWTFATAGQVVTARYAAQLAVGGSASFTLTVRLGAAAAPTLRNTAFVSGGGDASSGNNAATDSARVTVRVDLGLTVTDAPDPVRVGDTLTYTLQVKSQGAGSGTATGVRVVDYVPAGTTVLGASASRGTCGVGPVACNLGSLAAGDSARIAVRVLAPASAGTITDSARVSTTDIDTNAANDGASTSTLVFAGGVAVTPDSAAVAKLPSNGVAYSYAFTVTNGSPVTENFDLLASLSGGAVVTVDSITGSGVSRGARADSARLTGLAVGGKATVSVWYRTADVAAGTAQWLMLTARCVATPTVADPGSVDVSIARPALTIAKTVASGTVQPGQDLLYTVTLTNIGSESADSVRTTDLLPAPLQFKLGSGGGPVTPEYSQDGSSWTYTPASGACGAATGYDGCVRQIRWLLNAPLSQTASQNSVSYTFVARMP